MSESKNTREGKKNKNKINEAQSTIHNDGGESWSMESLQTTLYKGENIIESQGRRQIDKRIDLIEETFLLVVLTEENEEEHKENDIILELLEGFGVFFIKSHSKHNQ